MSYGSILDPDSSCKPIQFGRLDTLVVLRVWMPLLATEELLSKSCTPNLKTLCFHVNRFHEFDEPEAINIDSTYLADVIPRLRSLSIPQPFQVNFPSNASCAFVECGAEDLTEEALAHFPPMIRFLRILYFYDVGGSQIRAPAHLSNTTRLFQKFKLDQLEKVWVPREWASVPGGDDTLRLECERMGIRYEYATIEAVNQEDLEFDGVFLRKAREVEAILKGR